MLHRSTGCLSASILCVVVCSVATPDSGVAGDWPAWRGERGLGVSSEESLPAEWSTEKNIAWSVAVPEWGNSSPCVAGNRVYLTSQTADKTLWVVAIGCDKGDRLWKVRAGNGMTRHNELHNMATPTCVSDGDSVWALFGTGDLICLDRRGDKRWARNLAQEFGKYDILWGMGSSPRLLGGRLFIACMQPGPSYVVAIDAASGADAWKKERRFECVGEGTDSYSTPILLSRGNADELVVAGADHVNAYDPDTGDEKWVSGGLSIPHAYGRTIASPTGADGMVFAVSSGYGGLGRVLALDLAKKPPQGDITDTHRAWTYEKYSPDCPTPIVYRGLVYVLRDNGVGSCLVARTGEVKWRKRLLQGDCKSSPVAGDGKVYFTSKTGETVVLAAGPEFGVLARNRLAGGVMATPAISAGRLYIRTRGKLWAVGAK